MLEEIVHTEHLPTKMGTDEHACSGRWMWMNQKRCDKTVKSAYFFMYICMYFFKARLFPVWKQQVSKCKLKMQLVLLIIQIFIGELDKIDNSINCKYWHHNTIHKIRCGDFYILCNNRIHWSTIYWNYVELQSIEEN